MGAEIHGKRSPCHGNKVCGCENSRSDPLLGSTDLKRPQNRPMNLGGAMDPFMRGSTRIIAVRPFGGEDNGPHLSGGHTSSRQCYHGNKGKSAGSKISYPGHGM